MEISCKIIKKLAYIQNHTRNLVFSYKVKKEIQRLIVSSIVCGLCVFCFEGDSFAEGGKHMVKTNNSAPMTMLEEGFRRFQKNWILPKNSPYRDLKVGQSPKVLMIACSDSRLDPVMLTDAKPGEIFVIRNVANLVPPCELNDTSYHGVSAALEYAVKHLDVDVIIVLGHASCGGIQSLLARDDSYESNGFIDHWMDIAKRAKEIVDKKHPKASAEVRQRACEEWGIRTSIDNLMTFPWVRDKVKKGELGIYGWYFDLSNGELLQFEPKKDAFVSLVPGISK